MRDAEARERLSQLIAPMGGIGETITRIPPSSRLSEKFHMFSAVTANIGFIAPETMSARPPMDDEDQVGGAGSDLVEDKASIRALAECVERYANFMFLRSEVIVDTAQALGDAALPLESLPLCSDAEYADPACPLIRPRHDAPIRWVPSLSLHSGEEKLLPLVCTHLMHRPWPAELFTNSISTGVAAHFSPEKAMLNAICEVIERDAIANLWLARLPVPRFQPSDAQLADWGLNEDTAVRTFFFDATLDCRARTVYLLQLTDNHPFAAQIVGCATDMSLEVACRKVVRETLCYRTKFEHEIAIPARIEDFIRLQDGAAYMGRPEHREAFNFLIETEAGPMPAENDVPESDAEQLRVLLAALEESGLDVFAVDLTTDELKDVGLWAIRVVMPQLMPMSPIYRARLLGHKRVYDVARRFGRNPDFDELSINPFPQPFA
ncbi:MAG: YcaO-like family protein [Allosphingosinicella sp.]